MMSHPSVPLLALFHRSRKPGFVIGPGLSLSRVGASDTQWTTANLNAPQLDRRGPPTRSQMRDPGGLPEALTKKVVGEQHSARLKADGENPTSA